MFSIGRNNIIVFRQCLPFYFKYREARTQRRCLLTFLDVFYSKKKTCIGNVCGKYPREKWCWTENKKNKKVYPLIEKHTGENMR